MKDSGHLPLWWSFLKIGACGFGGGYAILPLIGHEVVDVRNWASLAEFSDMVALSQITPGPVAINGATYVGFTAGGFLGSVVATVAVCLPPFVFVTLACRFLLAFKDHPRVLGALRLLRPAAAGLVLAAALSLLNRENFIGWESVPVFLAALALTLWTKLDPITIIVLAGVAGLMLYAPAG
ncbi:MAG: chromate transporter [Planctomycetota bacterium]|nr:chromate transporter [Planctomycetota bacterium]